MTFPGRKKKRKRTLGRMCDNPPLGYSSNRISSLEPGLGALYRPSPVTGWGKRPKQACHVGSWPPNSRCHPGRGFLEVFLHKARSSWISLRSIEDIDQSPAGPKFAKSRFCYARCRNLKSSSSACGGSSCWFSSLGHRMLKLLQESDSVATDRGRLVLLAYFQYIVYVQNVHVCICT